MSSLGTQVYSLLLCQIISPKYLNFNDHDSLMQMDKWLLINSEVSFGPAFIRRRHLRTLQCAAGPSPLHSPGREQQLDACASPFTEQNVGSNEQHVNPSGYYTSACSVTTAVMAVPFISWAKSSSASWESCMINALCFLGPLLFLSVQWDMTNMKTDCKSSWLEIRWVWWATYKTYHMIFELFDISSEERSKTPEQH